MRKLFNKIKNKVTGALIVEYALLLALISIALIASLTLLGTNLESSLTAINQAIGSTIPQG